MFVVSLLSENVPRRFLFTDKSSRGKSISIFDISLSAKERFILSTESLEIEIPHVNQTHLSQKKKPSNASGCNNDALNLCQG